MREISFVDRLKFNFNGSVTKKALVIGDADNDQCNELVCANLQGDLAIFKDRNADKIAYASGLGMVTACLVGDVINSGKNYVAAINTEGWLFIFEVTRISDEFKDESTLNSPSNYSPSASDNLQDATNNRVDNDHTPMELLSLYEQRMPSNCKEMLLTDLDGDGQNEIIIGLTDRVLRAYRWIQIGPDRGKFVGLYKWEFADQIGSISLNPSRHDNQQDIIVAQPGGTYAKLECSHKKSPSTPVHGSTDSNATPRSSIDAVGELDTTFDSNKDSSSLSHKLSHDDDNVKTGYISKLTPEYHQLALGQMRSHHVSTEVLAGIRHARGSDDYSLIVIATLDGTMMLVNKSEILWSIQVDHQLFALAILESSLSRNRLLSQSESTCTIVPAVDYCRDTTSSSDGQNSLRVHKNSKVSQYFAACAWNGKTYIVDEDRNYLRFKFQEAVSAFTAGNYYFDGRHHSALVYATFNNQIVLYYDVLLENIKPVYLLDEILNNPNHSEVHNKLKDLAKKLGLSDDNENMLRLLREVLFSVTDDELEMLCAS